VDAATRAFLDSVIADLEPLARPAQPPLNYGRDLLCLNDLDARMTETDPNTVESIAQDAWHAIITERGTIIDAPDFGLGVDSALSQGRTITELIALGGRADQELSKDDRIATSVTTATVVGTDVRLSMLITPEDPTLRSFSLIVALTDGKALLQEMA
jgi:hypothetical protein